MTKKPWTNLDHRFMGRALRLARKGTGLVEPNPAVGAVLVKNNQIIGQGYHHVFGGPHAEIDALKNTRSKGHNPKNATLYVTLEPCCHWGKTPPCTQALIAAGIKKVIAATADPSKKVAGKGFRTLQKAGIKTQVGLMGDDARDLNPSFFKFHQNHLPWVVGKWAQTLDGKLAARSGHSQWISGPQARLEAHKLRRTCQAIVVGVGTVLADDPKLTVRHPQNTMSPILNRVVLDSRLRTGLSSVLVQTAHQTPTWIMTAKNVNRTKVKRLEQNGVKIVHFSLTPGGQINLKEFLKFAVAQNWTRILVEGGAGVLSAFLLKDLVDELVVFQTGLLALDDRAIQFHGRQTRKVGDFTSSFALRNISMVGNDAVLRLLRK
jgi:diaminohydroxyphosphoribosylaminopyrimidine deaminase / 5-amino-6-(5-phosphoribosylamino)uracil reductase